MRSTPARYHQPVFWGTVLAVIVLLAADGVAAATVNGRSDAKPPRPVMAPTTSSTTSSTVPPPPVPVGVYPLTGLPAFSAGRLARPALSVKVDNAADARPQSGLDAADIVTEELVEGGLTRFFVTYQSQDAPVVGPIRSARPVDTDLLTELGGGIFAFSGAAAGVLGPIQADSGAVLVTPDAQGVTFHRDPYRAAPANLYASTAGLYAAGERTGMAPARPLFSYSSAPPAGAPPIGSVSLGFSGSSSAVWTWNLSAHSYDRTQDGRSDLQVGGSSVTAADVVILSVSTVPSGDFDVLGHENFESVVVGTGPCWVLRDGVLIAGTWSRSGAAGSVRLVSSTTGDVIGLQPGRTWLELLPRPAIPAFS